MNKTLSITFTILCIVTIVNCVANFKKVVLTDSDALCLDGTPGAYYVHEGP